MREEGTSKRWPIEDLYDRDWTLGDVELPGLRSYQSLA